MKGFFGLLIVLYSTFCIAKNEIVKIKMFVIPIERKFRYSIEHNDVKKMADYKIVHNHSRNLLGFYELGEKLEKDNLIQTEKFSDFRILLILYWKNLQRDRVFLRPDGSFLFEGKFYKANGLLESLLPYLVRSDG